MRSSGYQLRAHRFSLTFRKGKNGPMQIAARAAKNHRQNIHFGSQ